MCVWLRSTQRNLWMQHNNMDTCVGVSSTATWCYATSAILQQVNMSLVLVLYPVQHCIKEPMDTIKTKLCQSTYQRKSLSLIHSKAKNVSGTHKINLAYKQRWYWHMKNIWQHPMHFHGNSVIIQSCPFPWIHVSQLIKLDDIDEHYYTQIK